MSKSKAWPFLMTLHSLITGKIANPDTGKRIRLLIYLIDQLGNIAIVAVRNNCVSAN